MIEITRRLARQVRNVVRRSLIIESPRGNWPVLRLRAGADGLHLQATHQSSALLYDDPQPRPTDNLAFSTEALAAFEGPMDVKVTLASVGAQKVQEEKKRTQLDSVDLAAGLV